MQMLRNGDYPYMPPGNPILFLTKYVNNAVPDTYILTCRVHSIQFVSSINDEAYL